MRKHLFITLPALVVLASCGNVEEDWITPGDTVTGPSVVEKKARAHVAGKVDVETVDVIVERERQRVMGRRVNRVVGYSAWVKGKGCSGSLVLYYDETAKLRRENNSLKC